MVFPIVYLLPNITGSNRQTIVGGGIFVSVFSTICILHGSRTLLLFQGYDIDKDQNNVLRRRKLSTVQIDEMNKVRTGVSGSMESLYGVSMVNPYEAVKTKYLLNRRQICREQIIHWSTVLRSTEAMMLMQADSELIDHQAATNVHIQHQLKEKPALLRSSEELSGRGAELRMIVDRHVSINEQVSISVGACRYADMASTINYSENLLSESKESTIENPEEVANI